ncbi:MAG: DUF4321 domain-containing protein [Alicyclobacillus sp.]|nr:DUF4321 domain-containing protein [Alicyclobacillus sp.]
MRKPFWRFAGLVFAGAVVGTLVGQLLAHQTSWLSRTTSVSWHPGADLGVLQYSLSLTLRVNALTLVGAAGGYLFARRHK